MPRAASKSNAKAPATTSPKERSVSDELLESASEDLAIAREADAASRLLLAAGVQDMTRAEGVEKVAERIGTLSSVVAAAGARDIAHGADLLEAATDVE